MAHIGNDSKCKGVAAPKPVMLPVYVCVRDEEDKSLKKLLIMAMLYSLQEESDLAQ